MQRLLNEEALRHFAANLPKNLVLPIAEVASFNLNLTCFINVYETHEYRGIIRLGDFLDYLKLK